MFRKITSWSTVIWGLLSVCLGVLEALPLGFFDVRETVIADYELYCESWGDTQKVIHVDSDGFSGKIYSSSCVKSEYAGLKADIVYAVIPFSKPRVFKMVEGGVDIVNTDELIRERKTQAQASLSFGIFMVIFGACLIYRIRSQTNKER